MKEIKTLICTVVLTLCHCKGSASTKDLLEGEFLTAGQKPIELIAPKDNEALITAPTFSWTSRTGIENYSVEMASDSAFANLVLKKTVSGTSYTLDNNDLIGITQLDSIGYYWRVKVNVSGVNNLMSTSRIIYKLAVNLPVNAAGIPAGPGASGFAGTLYVDVNQTTNQAGNKTAPYTKIQSAIGAADFLRNGNKDVSFDILVAGGGGRIYSEAITMSAGISIRGGYDPSTNWSRNIAANVTTIQAPFDTAITIGNKVTLTYQNTTIVEGFTINVNPTGAALIGISLVSASPKILSNTINITSTTKNGKGIDATGGNPNISGNTINATGTTGQISYGIALNGTTATITGNTINATSSAEGRAIQATNGGSLTATGNTITLSNATNLFGFHLTSAPATLLTNVISAPTVLTARGIFVGTGASSTFSNNTITFANCATDASGFELFNDVTSPITVTGNTITLGGANCTSRGALLNGAGSYTFSNNNFSATGNFAAGVLFISGTPDLTFRGNTLTVLSVGASNQTTGLYLLSGGTASVTNNVISAINAFPPSGNPHGVGIEMGATGAITNNTIIVASNYANSNTMGIKFATSAVRVTNNIFVTLGGPTQYMFYENTSRPASIENNVIWPATIALGVASGYFFTYNHMNGNQTCATFGGGAICTTDITFENNGTIYAPSDKARGNYMLPAGASGGSPFVNFPKYGQPATGASSTTLTFGTAPVAATFANGDYVEINGDQIPRQITCAGTCTSPITFTPSNGISNLYSLVYNWGTHAGAASCFSTNPGVKCNALAWDLRINPAQPAAITATDWKTLKYGGKDTSGFVCGLNAGYPTPTTGPGIESCGIVTDDRDGIARTTSAVAGTTDSSGNYNKCPGGATGPCGAQSPADPQGFSIGAYERD